MVDAYSERSLLKLHFILLNVCTTNLSVGEITLLSDGMSLESVHTTHRPPIFVHFSLNHYSMLSGFYDRPKQNSMSL